jgi:hypothetical protein
MLGRGPRGDLLRGRRQFDLDVVRVFREREDGLLAIRGELAA